MSFVVSVQCSVSTVSTGPVNLLSTSLPRSASTVENVWKLMGNKWAPSHFPLRYCLNFESSFNFHKFTFIQA